MRNLLKPRWLFVVNSLPVALLFAIFWGEFNVIKSLLKRENIELWIYFSSTLGALALLNFAYAAYISFKKRAVSPLFGIIALATYVPFLYLYMQNAGEVIPPSIPQWMIPGNMEWYVVTFLMPTLAYALFVLVAHFTPVEKEHQASPSFLFAVLIPFLWFAFFALISQLSNVDGGKIFFHLATILFIASTIAFLFFLIRGIYIIGAKRSEAFHEYQLAWKFPFAIILPLLGLAINNGFSFNNFSSGNSGVFGDFSHPAFYILALLNGILLCLPPFKNVKARLTVFVGRSVLLAYTLYFFLVFLPFLPLSILAIIFIGTGFLMLTPLVLFVIHIHELSKDFAFLKTAFSKNIIGSSSFASFLVIPALLTLTYLNDRNVLHETLDYVYMPDYSKEYSIDKNSLKKTLDVVYHHKSRSREPLFISDTPFLSSYYNWIVLDNLTLSDAKIGMLNNVFFAESPREDRRWREGNTDEVKLVKTDVKSEFDSTQNAWKSWIDLELLNNSDNRLAEYVTKISLPDGCWISNYYLYIGDKKEPGFLAEKKSAMWVYSQIRVIENRDPGLLYYLSGNTVAFRVYPFAAHEKRKTGIEILHREPVEITLGGKTVQLGNENGRPQTGFENENVLYVSAQQKKSLQPVQRKPYFHILADASFKKDSAAPQFIQQIEALSAKYPDIAANARISFVNTYTTTIPLKNGWQQQYLAQNFDGGMYLERAIKQTLVNSFKENSDWYPVIVAVTDDIRNAILETDFADFAMAFPESSEFYVLNPNGQFRAHSLIKNPAYAVSDTLPQIFKKPALAYKTAGHKTFYLADNNQPSLLLKDLDVTTENAEGKNQWESALMMQAMWQAQVFQPEASQELWLKLIQQSFKTGVMTPATSYLVVENEAQKAAMLRKQEQVLSANKSLDIDEETLGMSEPEFFVSAALLGVVVWFRRKKLLVNV